MIFYYSLHFDFSVFDSATTASEKYGEKKCNDNCEDRTIAISPSIIHTYLCIGATKYQSVAAFVAAITNLFPCKESPRFREETHS